MATTPITVGSGEIDDVSLSLSASSILTWTKGTPRSTTATVSAKDETGLKVPFTGNVVASVGGKTSTVSVTSTTGAAAKAVFSASKLALGTGTVVATVNGANGSQLISDAAKLKVVQTAVTSVALSAPHSTVYPAHDGYIDSLKFTVTPKTTRTSSFPSTGKVTITRNGKTVKSWTLTSSKVWAATWDGKVDGKIVPGTYSVKVSLKGPEGHTQTATKTVTVDSGKLMTKTKTITYKASSVLKNVDVRQHRQHRRLCDLQRYRRLLLLGRRALRRRHRAIGYGSITVPSYVLAAQKYGAPRQPSTLQAS